MEVTRGSVGLKRVLVTGFEPFAGFHRFESGGRRFQTCGCFHRLGDRHVRQFRLVCQLFDRLADFRQCRGEFVERFGNENFTVVYAEDTDLFTPGKLQALSDLAWRLGRVEGIERVESLFTSDVIRSEDGVLASGPILDPLRTILAAPNRRSQMRTFSSVASTPTRSGQRRSRCRPSAQRRRFEQRSRTSLVWTTTPQPSASPRSSTRT